MLLLFLWLLVVKQHSDSQKKLALIECPESLGCRLRAIRVAVRPEVLTQWLMMQTVGCESLQAHHARERSRRCCHLRGIPIPLAPCLQHVVPASRIAKIKCNMAQLVLKSSFSFLISVRRLQASSPPRNVPTLLGQSLGLHARTLPPYYLQPTRALYCPVPIDTPVRLLRAHFGLPSSSAYACLIASCYARATRV